jgi:hypothetical protein
MSRKSLAPRVRSPKAVKVVPFRTPTHLAVVDLDEFLDVARGVRLLDLAMMGLDVVSKDCGIDRAYHVEPLMSAVGALHTAVYRLEQRLGNAEIPIPRAAVTPA